MIDSLRSILRQFGPDLDGLLSSLCEVIVEDDLRVIAECDAGMDFEENLESLRAIHRTGSVPDPLKWNPKEVCELTRWEEPTVFKPSQVRTARNPELVGARRRAFACAILLRSAANDREGRSMGENSTAAALIGSSLVLSRVLPGVLTRTSQALAAVAMSESFIAEEERVLLALGVLLSAVADRQYSEVAVPGDSLRLLGEAILANDARIRETDEMLLWSDDELLGLTNFDQRHCLWRSLAKHILLDPLIPHPREADEILKRIGSLLVQTPADAAEDY